MAFGNGVAENKDRLTDIGMNFDQWDKDRRGFRTSEKMVTGGDSAAFGAFSGHDVGDHYQDGMSEERTDVTFVSGNTFDIVHNPPGVGKGSRSGKISSSAPQVYSKG